MLIQTEDQFNELVADIEAAKLIVADTETRYCNFQADRYIIGLAILCPSPVGEKVYYLPVRHSHDTKMFKNVENVSLDWLYKVIRLLQGKKTIWHNAKFDLLQIDKECENKEFLEDIDVNKWYFYDTMLMAHMVDSNRFDYSLYELGKLLGQRKLGNELDTIAVALGGGGANKEEKHKAKCKGWQLIPPDVMGRYAEEDVLITWLLFKWIFPQLQNNELDHLWERTMKVCNVVRKLEDNGVLVDRAHARQLSIEAQSRMDELEQEFGFDPGKPAQLAHKLYALPPEGLGFQPQSFSKRKSKEFSQGLPNMDEQILSRLDHPFVEQVLEWRKLGKAKSTWYGGWDGLIGPDSRLHPNFKQFGTVTSRWSCEHPNLQQLPRDVERSPVKKLLRATPGYELWEFDYSQVEFRLGSVYAQCYTILNAYREGLDVHAITAQNIGAYQKFPDNPDFARYVGKQTNFLTIYGGGAEVLKMQLWRDAKIDVPVSECAKILKAFHTAYPEFKTIAQKCKNVADNQGYIKYWNGWKRFFTDTGKFCNTKDAYNSMVQGGAGHIMMESMLMLDDLNYRLCCQVHDSVWIEIPVEQVEIEVPKIKEIMGWPSEQFGCPFPVDAKRLAVAA